MKNPLAADETDNYLVQEWRQLETDTAVLMPDMPISQIDLKTFNLVRSFCFVGDIGYDPGELMAALSLPQPAAESSEKSTAA